MKRDTNWLQWINSVLLALVCFFSIRVFADLDKLMERGNVRENRIVALEEGRKHLEILINDLRNRQAEMLSELRSIKATLKE